MLLKADGTNFPSGGPWKYLSCGIPPENALSPNQLTNYPHIFRSGEKALWGSNILQCGGAQLTDCVPDEAYVYPIRWNTEDSGGELRELKMHPDDVHLAWSSFTDAGSQHAYFGRLELNTHPEAGEAPRYDLVNVQVLLDPSRMNPIFVDGNELQLDHGAITIGELRGFSGCGDEVLYVGSSVEATTSTFSPSTLLQALSGG